MQKKYLTIFMSLIVGFKIHLLNAIDLNHQKNNALSVLTSSEMSLSEKLHSSEMFITLQKMSNDQTHSVLISSDAISDEAINMELKKFGLSPDQIISFKKNYLKQFFTVRLSTIGVGIASSTLSCVTWIIGYLLASRAKNYQEGDSLIIGAIGSGLAAGVVTFGVSTKYAGPFFSTIQRSSNYLKQVKKVNFNNYSLTVLKVPSDFIGITIQFLIEQGFKFT